MATEQVRVTLPEPLMRAISLMAQDKDSTPMDVLTVAILASFGYALYSEQTTIAPSRYALPESQWNRISMNLMHVAGTDNARVNLGLDWVNLSPSVFKDEPADVAT